jgi:hypothetical protein
MAFGALSAIFNVWQYTVAYPTTSQNAKLSSTTYKAALYNNTGTPDNTATAVLSSYNGAASAWVTGNEVIDATNWVAGGRAIGTPTAPPGAYSAQNFVMLDAADTAGGGNVTLSNVYGDLVYDTAVTTPVANLGIAYHSYGGSAQGVTAGTFTIIWHANGIVRWTHTPA